MVIWKGLGILVPLIIFAVLIGAQASVDSVMGDGFYTDSDLAQGVALMLGGFVSFLWSSWRNRRWIVILREETADGIEFGGADSLFFVPTEYWSLAVVLGGALHWVL